MRRAARSSVVLVTVVAVALGLLAPADALAAPLTPRMERALEVSAEKLKATDARTPVGGYPFITSGASAWRLGGTTGWVNGFLPGSLWYDFALSGDAASRDSARARQRTFESHATRTNNHDLGFLFMAAHGNAYRITGDRRARETLLTAASSLASRYDARVGMVRSTNTREDFRVIIDTTMNIELLFWGARNGGDPRWREMATSHALKASRDFIRSDGSTVHFVGYRESDGAVLRKGQVQGYSAESTWSRGQAWMIHGMSIAYRETGDHRFLDAARRATRYWIAHVPDDFVPYWDFAAPQIPDEPRDSSAAAIAASAFVELSQLDPDPRWRGTYADLAGATLESLSSPAYLAEGIALPAVLKHGTHAASIGMADHGTSWGDYYFREALMRYGTAVERVGGPDRYHTSARTSSSSFDSARTVVVASGESYPDALSAAGLAGTLDAPLLLTGATSLPGTVRSEILRLKPSQVVIVGGTAAVSSGVQSSIAKLPGVRVSRVSGADRFATAARVADRVLPGSTGAPIVFIARGDEFADALAAAPVAYAQEAPVLLSSSDALPPATARAVARLRPERIVILGGEASLSPAVASALRAASPSSAVTRVGGQDRYETALRFARWARAQGLGDATSIGVVSGRDYPDALGASAAVGSQGGLIVMTQPDALHAGVATWIAGAADENTRVTVFGGESVVSGRAEYQVRTRLPERRARR